MRLVPSRLVDIGQTGWPLRLAWMTQGDEVLVAHSISQVILLLLFLGQWLLQFPGVGEGISGVCWGAEVVWRLCGHKVKRVTRGSTVISQDSAGDQGPRTELDFWRSRHFFWAKGAKSGVLY